MADDALSLHRYGARVYNSVVLRVYRYRLYPTASQIKAIRETLERLRVLYNAALQERRDAYRKQGVSVTRAQQERLLTEIKRNESEYTNLHTHLMQDAVTRLDRAFQAFFRRVKAGQKPGYPRFKGRGRYRSFSFKDAIHGNGAKLVSGNKRLRISGVGNVKIKLHRPIEGRIKTIGITLDGDGRFLKTNPALVAMMDRQGEPDGCASWDDCFADGYWQTLQQALRTSGTVEIEVIAERTPGFSGADLANLMNEGAIVAAREERTEITQYDLIRSIEKVMLGPERKSHVLNKKEKEITAYHEAGHALVSSVLEYADPVHKVSVISRGRAAGYTLHLPFEDRKMHSKKEFLDDIAVSLGGYVAEEMIFSDVTTGPSNDLQVLTNLARNMVTRWGMSDKIGTVALVGDGGRALFGGGIDGAEHSQAVAAIVDEEVRKIIDTAKKRAKTILVKHRDVLDAIAQVLIDKETIERDEFDALLLANGIVPKKKEDIEHQA
jgi:hypothetical protein